MFELWIPITVAAACIQALRTALQKHMFTTLPNRYVNFARYAFGAPLAVAAIATWTWFGPHSVPNLSANLIIWCAVIGLAQILGTWGLICAFTTRNMATAVTFAKTETLQTALLSIIILGEQLTPMGWIAILLSGLGILVLTLPVASGPVSAPDAWKGAAYGLFAGAMFGLSATAIRTASLGLGDYDFISRSLLVLAVTTVLQLLMLGCFLLWRDRAGFAAFLRAWPLALIIGLTSIAGSAGWFAAMTLQKAAYVQALGQIELVISVIITRAAFREFISRWELLGIALFGIGISIVLFGRT
jgi:drug/metabolite transporter (DMT)-like permease